MKYDISKINFSQNGKGEPPILFLHGWGSAPESFSSIITPISEHRETVAIALPGFGKSPPPPEAYGTWDYVEVLNRLLDSHGIDIVDIIAHSFGGRVTIGFASRYPHKVNRIVLISSAGLTIPRSLKTRMKIFLAKTMTRAGQIFGGEVGKRLEEKKQRLGSSDWRAASPVMRKTLSRVIREDLTEELRKIQASAMLIWGENDSAVPPRIGQRMANLLPNAEFITIANAGHYCFLDRKGETLSAIWRHLELPMVW